MTELKTLKDLNSKCEDFEAGITWYAESDLRQEAIKWLKVMNKEDWDNRTYITDVWKDFFNITDEDLKGDEK